jgi:hypothetical protein
VTRTPPQCDLVHLFSLKVPDRLFALFTFLSNQLTPSITIHDARQRIFKGKDKYHPKTGHEGLEVD